MNFYKSFGIYTICGLLAKGLSFLLLPFFTRYLSQSDYGILAIFTNSVYFIAPLMNLGVGDTFTVEYSQLDKKNLTAFVSTSLAIPFMVLLVVALLVSWLGDWVQQLTGLSLTLQYLICIFAFSNFFSEYLFTILRNRNKPVIFGLFAIAKTALELMLAVYFIRFCNDGYIGRVKSMLITAGIAAIACLVYLLRNGFIRPAFNKGWMRLIMKRGLPTIPLFLMVFLLNNTDNYTVNYFHGAAVVGPYALACQIALLVNFLGASFITPFYPFMYDSLHKGQYQQVVSLVTKYMMLVAALVLLLGFVTPLLFDLVIGHKFHQALKYLWWLLLGQLFFNLYMVLAGFVFYRKHNHIYYYFCPVIIALTLGINYYLIGVLRLQQFGIASALSYFLCMAGLAAVYHKQIFKALRMVGMASQP